MHLDPWFSSWNDAFLRLLFDRIPHSRVTDEFSDLLISNPLLSAWVFSAWFYRYWMKEDEDRSNHKQELTSAVIALVVAGVVTLVLRPWIHWPAPVLNPAFRSLFPQNLWGNGNGNCFPSHSTLAYFTIAAGFWTLNRWLSVWLCAMSLLFVALPRIYLGGHYPIDVLFSCILAIFTLMAVRRLRRARRAPSDLPGFAERALSAIFYLWVFELGEGFRSAESLVRMGQHAYRWWR